MSSMQNYHADESAFDTPRISSSVVSISGREASSASQVSCITSMLLPPDMLSQAPSNCNLKQNMLTEVEKKSIKNEKIEEGSECGDSRNVSPTPRYLELREVMSKTTSEAVIMIKSRPKKHMMRTERGSKYRGVSKNGKKWQVSKNTINYYQRVNLSLVLCKNCKNRKTILCMK